MPDFRTRRDKNTSDYRISYGSQCADAYASGYTKEFQKVQKEKENTRVLGFWNGWSTTKTWKSLFLMSDYTTFGAFLIGKTDDPPDYIKSESYKDAERKADKAGATAAYEEALKNGLQGDKLAELAEKAEFAKVYADKSKERHNGTFGAIFGITAAIALAIMLPPIGFAAIAAIIIAPLVGFAYDRFKDIQAESSATEAGATAAQETRDGVRTQRAQEQQQEVQPTKAASAQQEQTTGKNFAQDVTQKRDKAQSSGISVGSS